MCRYDDDYDWMVDGRDDKAVSDSDERCEDCGRTIPAGEQHTLFTCVETYDEDRVEDDDGNPRYLWVAQHRDHARRHEWPRSTRVSWTVVESKPYIVIDEDDCDMWDALGFVTSDDVDNPAYQREEQTHLSCAQCIIANEWLVKICNQSVVQVTVVDIDSHTDEYEPPMLGADFMRLHRWSRRGWKASVGVVPAGVVRATTERAIAHAVAVGLDGNH